ncbi:right-handed parallel beta-helix repeat-containing protein [Ideonella sp. YS5]|uniref:right-handed parallel beta-helix repeat-containing protein n=1 Tax=Ideonella sp. YS5 TaxID=3453714 RepID=UPI003EEB94BB
MGWLACMGAVLACGSAVAADIHMATNGDDARDGRTPASAVASLGRAFDLALSDPRGKSEAMRIVVGTGTYKGQAVVLDGARLGREVTVIGAASEPKDFPTFVGDDDHRTWLLLKSDKGQRTGLTIQALEIRGYATAISLEGNRDAVDKFNSGTTIRRNVFSHIGSVDLKSSELSTAAIRFVNSQDNVVEDNFFATIRNKEAKQCGGLHAIYLAHFSSRNRIKGNTFQDACGSVIKLRDRSNDNVIENNRFKKVEDAPVIEEWFCDKDARKDCTKKLGECPSTGNRQQGNTQSDSRNSKLIDISAAATPRGWCAKDDFAKPRVVSN